MATIIYSVLNPVPLYLMDPEENPMFRSKHIDDYVFSETILEWESPACFAQMYQRTDNLRIQLQTDVGPVNCEIWDAENDMQVGTVQLTSIMQNAENPAMYIYQLDLQWINYPQGVYYCVLRFGSPGDFRLRTDNLNIRDNHVNSILIQYRNFRFYGDMIFEGAFQTNIRIPGSLKLKGTSSRDTVFEDQNANLEMLRSVPFRVWTLRIGNSFGIPDLMHDLLVWVFGCSELFIEGRQYTKNEGAIFEERTQPNFPLRAWSIDLRERYNRAGKRFENDTLQTGKLSVLITSNSKGFGMDDSGSNSIVKDVI